MSKTPLCDLRSARAYRGTYNEFIEVLEFARKLETDRAELVELLIDFVKRGDWQFGESGWPAHFQPALSKARALLAKLEAK